MPAIDAETLLIETTPLGPIPEYYETVDSLENMMVA